MAEEAAAEREVAEEAVAVAATEPPVIPRLGIGIGWRPEIDLTVERLSGVDFVEVIAESLHPGHLPASLAALRARGASVIPHGVSLSLGGAERPDAHRLAHLAQCAEALQAPLVSEHLAFVRAGGLEVGHLLPVPRTWEAVEVLSQNIRIAQESLPVPLALENIAALFAWPDDELTEGQFVAEIVDRTGVLLLVDVANLHTCHVNLGQDPEQVLDHLPLEKLAYVHVAGGVLRDGLWHDTHRHPVTGAVLDVLAALAERTDVPGALLERDGDYPEPAGLAGELAAIRATVEGVR